MLDFIAAHCREVAQFQGSDPKRNCRSNSPDGDSHRFSNAGRVIYRRTDGLAEASPGKFHSDSLGCVPRGRRRIGDMAYISYYFRLRSLAADFQCDILFLRPIFSLALAALGQEPSPSAVYPTGVPKHLGICGRDGYLVVLSFIDGLPVSLALWFDPNHLQ